MVDRIKIIIACHKKYPVPNDNCYIPIEVGAALHSEQIIGFVPDNTGDNISDKNKNYCELTAHYWAWKNLEADIIGSVHYRRYFTNRAFSKRVVSEHEILKKLEEAPVILPTKRHYWIETNYSQYIHAHHEEDLITTRDVLLDLFPDYMHAFDTEMAKRSGHRFNMFIMQRDLYNAYCEWLFSILFEVEKRLDISCYDSYNCRVFGFVAERLLDVWMMQNSISFVELPVFNTERQHWIRKGIRFIMRKLMGDRK